MAHGARFAACPGRLSQGSTGSFFVNVNLEWAPGIMKASLLSCAPGVLVQLRTVQYSVLRARLYDIALFDAANLSHTRNELEPCIVRKRLPPLTKRTRFQAISSLSSPYDCGKPIKTQLNLSSNGRGGQV